MLERIAARVQQLLKRGFDPGDAELAHADPVVEGSPALAGLMGQFVDFLHSLDRIKQKFPPENVFVTRLLEEVDPKLVKWKSKTDVRQRDVVVVVVVGGVEPRDEAET